ncbi:MAG: hypothetical protein ACTSRS_05085 [Candidatus Helarchaeota archaeon]
MRELYARILSLGKKRIPTISPFNPPNGFYVWSVSDLGPLSIQILGRNIKETVLNFAHYILKNLYHVERRQKKYLYILLKKKMPVGKLFFTRRGSHRQECLIAKIGKEKLLFRFDNKGLFIDITLHCPHPIKSALFPLLLQEEREFSQLCRQASLTPN